MDKCFHVTTLLLVCLIAVVESLDSYKCEKDEEEDNNNADTSDEQPDLRLELPSDISDTTSTKHYLCNDTNNETVQKLQCNAWNNYFPTTCSDNWSSWSSWSDCIKGYKHRSLKCHSSQSECFIPTNGSSFEIRTCIPEEENGKEVEKRYTLTEIILVALCCLLMGILLTSLVFVFYMKMSLRGCFSKHIKDVHGDSKQQSGPHMQFLTESGVVKKYCPNNPKSADSKNDNKADETNYQSLSSNQVSNDQQTYNQFNVNEPGSDHQGHHPSSSRLQQTGNRYQIDQITNLQHKNEYFRDSDIDGHNYFVLERQNVSQESRARNLGRPETHAKIDDEVKYSTLGTEDKQSDAAHQYFILEHIENGHNQD